MQWSPLEWSPLIFAALGAGLVLGAGAVLLFQRRAGAADRERADQLAAELEETREELEGHREEVARHFERSSELFRDMTEQYTRLYAHLAEGARSFCPDELPSLDLGLTTPLPERSGASAEAAGGSERNEAPSSKPSNGDGRAAPR